MAPRLTFLVLLVKGLAPISSLLHLAPCPHIHAHRPAHVAPFARHARLSRSVIALAGEDPGDGEEEEQVNPYRILGINEDASYDDIMDRYITLSEKYAKSPAMADKVEKAKDKVLTDRLSKRISDPSKVVVSDREAKRIAQRKPPWWKAVQLLKFLRKGFQIPPTRQEVLSVGSLAEIFFLYNRGEPGVPVDDMGQIGEIRPMKNKPVAVTCLIVMMLYISGYNMANSLKRTAPLWIPFAVVRNIIVFGYYSIAAFTLRVQAIVK